MRYLRICSLAIATLALAALSAPTSVADPTFTRTAAPGPYIGLSEADFAKAESYTADDVIVATTFFYWYNCETGESWWYEGGSSTLGHRPIDADDYRYDSVEWHKRQMRDMVAAGIDVVLPVYWGDPNHKAEWSFVGLRTLVEAQRQMVEAGEPTPRIGMFHATISLEWGPDGTVDLTKPYGHEWFYQTIRDFWCIVPPSRWAMIHGKPLVFLYAAFAEDHDQSCIEFVRREFAKDFAGRTPYIVRGDGWNVETESRYSWGAAVGPKLYPVAAVGPGYDDSVVPGRKPLVVDREGGAFYRRAWELLLRMDPERRPKLVHVETWNELHEATEICHTVEFGRQYIRMTRRYSDLYRRGVRLPRRGPFSRLRTVRWDAETAEEHGLVHLAEVGDGPSEATTRAGRSCRVALPNPFGGTVRYLYFDLDDSFAFDEAGDPFALEVTCLDVGTGLIALQYDSGDPEGSIVEGAFKDGGQIELGDTGEWVTHAFRIADGRFINRVHGGDFRLAGIDGDLAVAQLNVSRHHGGG